MEGVWFPKKKTVTCECDVTPRATRKEQIVTISHNCGLAADRRSREGQQGQGFGANHCTTDLSWGIFIIYIFSPTRAHAKDEEHGIEIAHTIERSVPRIPLALSCTCVRAHLRPCTLTRTPH